jgi:dynactin complex subunit
VEKIRPQVVNTDPNGYKSVEYSKLVALLIEAMKEQQKKIDALTAENQTLKNNSGAVSDEVKLMRADLKSLHDALDILLKENITLKEGQK